MMNENQTIRKSNLKHQGVIEKLFDMMEKFNQHMVQNENKIWNEIMMTNPNEMTT